MGTLHVVIVHYLIDGPARASDGSSKCLANDTKGVPWVLRGLRGVIHIIQEVIDKVGLNQLLVPYQSLFPLFPSSQRQQCQPSVLLTPFPSIPWAIPWGLSSWQLSSLTTTSSIFGGVPPSLLILIQLLSMGGPCCLTQRMTCLRIYILTTCVSPLWLHLDCIRLTTL
jgi:hypothetical protein